MKTFQNLTLNGPSGNFHTPIESFSYQFEKQKWKKFYNTEFDKIPIMEPSNFVLGGEFSIVKIPDDRSFQIINANADSNQEFLSAAIVMKTNQSSLIIKFFNVLPFNLSKIGGRDTITFSFKTTNIPRFPDKNTIFWKIAHGRLLG